ncbi:hypothetical protein CLF_110044 [Clonorchis sinensis]|uniref:Uncharacterized protein n=1 Tax=Clonorchis sinensis TaxID=79923 RepID=G7YT53_CLOSI|nr:hypothetical protein CLF_110044 [Clonorchis sinensis]
MLPSLRKEGIRSFCLPPVRTFSLRLSAPKLRLFKCYKYPFHLVTWNNRTVVKAVECICFSLCFSDFCLFFQFAFVFFLVLFATEYYPLSCVLRSFWGRSTRISRIAVIDPHS